MVPRFLWTTVLLAACAPIASPPTSPLESMAMAPGMQAPSHPPATPAEWSAAEANAADVSTKARAKQVDKPLHVTGQGAFVQQRIAVVGGACYDVGIGWAFSAKLHATVMFENNENTQIAGHSETLTAPAGVLKFCADKSGAAVLTLSALSKDGAMAASERLEYAVAVGSHKEAGGDAEARRLDEGKRATLAQATMDANVANARARDEANRASRCKRCDEDYRACQVDASFRRRHPTPGMSVNRSCESKFTLCSHNNSYVDAQRHAGDRPCGDPPR